MAKKQCRKKTPVIQSPTTAELVSGGDYVKDMGTVERSLLDAYGVEQEISKYLSQSLNAQMGSAKGTLMSIDGSIDSQLRNALVPAKAVLDDVSLSIQTQLDSKLGSAFEKAASVPGSPTITEGLSTLYGTADSGGGFIIDPSAFKCSNGAPLSSEVLEKVFAIVQGCANKQTSGRPGEYVACVMNGINGAGIEAPCIDAARSIASLLVAGGQLPGIGGPGGGVIQQPRFPQLPVGPNNPNDPTIPPIIPGGPAPGPGGGPTQPGGPTLPGYPPPSPGAPSYPGYPPVIPGGPAPFPPIVPPPTTPPTTPNPPTTPPTTPPTVPPTVPPPYTPPPPFVPPPPEHGGPPEPTPEEASKGCRVNFGANNFDPLPGMYIKRYYSDDRRDFIQCPEPAPDTTYPPSNPPPNTGCCPVNVTVNCADHCKTDDKPSSGAVNLWKGQTGDCYVLPKGVASRGPSDALVYTSDTAGIDLASLNEKCKPGGSSSGSGTTGPAAKEMIGDCELMFPVELAGYITDPEKLSRKLGLDSNFATQVLKPLVQGFFQLHADLLSVANCGDPRWTAVAEMQFVTNIVDKWIGSMPSAVSTSLTQSANYLCPVQLPSPSEAVSAYMANTITDETLKCWVKASGMKWESFSHVVDAQQSKPIPADLVSLWRRKVINDDQYLQRMRELGFTNPRYATEVAFLSNQIPPASDLVRFMVRDTDDERVVQQFGLDDEFEAKFGQQIQDWSYAQGVDPTYMRYIWRAHWSIPSPTQLFEFWHRLRHTGEFGTAEELYNDVRNALIQQDILPYWIDAYLAVSYRPLTRVDARRMFETGQLTEKELFLQYTDMGYSDDNATRLVEFSKTQRRQKWKSNKVVKDYIAGVLSGDQFNNLMKGEGATDQEIITVGTWANGQRSLNRRRVCQKAWRRRFLLGEFDSVEARQIVIRDGIDAGIAEEIVAGWECEKATKGKAIPAAKVGQWYAEGIIGQADVYNRLINLGYKSDDAVNLIREFELRIVQRQQATQKKLLAEQVRRQKETEAQARRLMSDADRVASKRQSALDRANKATQKRKHLLLETALAFSQNAGLEIGPAVDIVENIVKTIAANGPYVLDQVLENAVQVAKLQTTQNPDDLTSAIIGAMETESIDNPSQ